MSKQFDADLERFDVKCKLYEEDCKSRLQKMKPVGPTYPC